MRQQQPHSFPWERNAVRAEPIRLSTAQANSARSRSATDGREPCLSHRWAAEPAPYAFGVGLDDQERHGHRGQRSRSHSTPIPSAQANALGGGISLARNDPQPTTSPLNDSTFAGNSATASYTGTGTGLAQAIGAAIPAAAIPAAAIPVLTSAVADGGGS